MRLKECRCNIYDQEQNYERDKEGKKVRGTPEEAAFLDLLRTCDLLSRGPAQFLNLLSGSQTGKRVGEWAWQFMSERGY
jgi:hypothetical protein